VRRIKVIDYHVVTVLPTREIASAFREGIRSPGGFAGFVGRAMLEWDFFTPEASTDPFAALEGPKVEPTFEVAASYGLRQRRYKTRFEEIMEAGVGGAVHLSVWDEGDRRRIKLRHAGDLSPASKKSVQAVMDRLAAQDPALRLNSEKGTIDG
jgi:hypothetical protein